MTTATSTCPLALLVHMQIHLSDRRAVKETQYPLASSKPSRHVEEEGVAGEGDRTEPPEPPGEQKDINDLTRPFTVPEEKELAEWYRENNFL